ncbi:MAG: tripartite tricarboxylate transporter TctB family protein [Deltaproteobacteria bacterium]|nr:tripartite tricarboxylate transporter TctB family protein [Deltaproteobacteria bacterium]
MEDNTERKPGERFLMWFLLALSLFVFIVALQMPHNSFSSTGAFPIFIGAVMVLSILRILWKDRKAFASWKWKEERHQIKSFVFPRLVVLYTIALILYIVLLYPLHFWLSSFLFLVGSFLLLKGARLLKGLVIGAIMLALIWLLFQYIFRIVLW